MPDDVAKANRKELTEELEKQRNDNNKQAHNLEGWITTLLWLQMIAAGAAFALGLIHWPGVQAWMVSIVAGVTAGCSVVVRGGKLRERANWFYAYRDMADNLLYRLRFEMPEPIDLATVAALSCEFRERREKLGQQMQGITADWPTNKSQNC